MKTVLRKIDWLQLIEVGWGNGYVIIPKGHKLHGEHYDSIDVDIHGGLTYSEELTKGRAEKMFTDCGIEESDIGGWIVGFDCAHYGDDLSTCPKSFVELEVKRLEEQLMNLS